MSEPAGWILYDGDCGFCSRWVPFWDGTLRARGFRIAPLQSDWVRARLSLGDTALLQDLRLLLKDGRQIQGADVYRHVLRRIWWAYPLYLLSVTPLLRGIFDRGYRAFASNRYGISRACGMEGRRS
jgi:predicted DCC family thiol-disulfide oxidoreductase YuxK